MNNYNDELAKVHIFLKRRLDAILQSDEVVDHEQIQQLAHAVLFTGTIAYDCTITKKKSPKVDKEIFYNTIYDD